MGNRVYEYLKRFRQFSINQIVNHKLYLYTGNDSKIIRQRDFYFSFINNYVFRPRQTRLYNLIYDSKDDDNLLPDLLKSLQEYIISLDNVLKNYASNNSTGGFNYQLLKDAIQVLNILKVGFTWHEAKEFDGKAISLFDKAYDEYVDEPINNVVIKDIINARIKGEYGYGMDLNHILYYKADNDDSLNQLLNYLIAEHSYDGLLLFTAEAFQRLRDYIKNSDNYKNFYYSPDNEAYYYINFETESEDDCYLRKSRYLLSFYSIYGKVFKLVTYIVTNSSFDKTEYRDCEATKKVYNIDDFMDNGEFKLVIPTHIDVFV